MPFIPPNEQLQQLFGQMVQNAGGMFSGAFDNAYARQLQEQKNANNLFETLARANPALASFVAAQPGVAESLTKTPRTFQKEGAGAKIEGAVKKYTPAGTSAGKATTIPAAGGLALKIAQGYKVAYKKDLPPGVVEKMTQDFASGLPPNPTAYGLTNEEFSAAASASGDNQVALQTEVYRGLVAEEEKKAGKPLTEEQKADIYLRLTAGKSQDVRDQMTKLAIERLQQAVSISDLQSEFMKMRNETMANKPMSVEELRKATESHDSAAANATLLTKAANSLSTITPDNPASFVSLQGMLRQIQGNDPAAVAVRDAVLSVATLVMTADPAQRQQQLTGLRELFLRARDHFQQIESIEADAIKRQSKKPTKPGDAADADATTPDTGSDEVDELEDLLGSDNPDEE